MVIWFFFFFQAEDGIRDYKVTGVQTCALPICERHVRTERIELRRARRPPSLEKLGTCRREIASGQGNATEEKMAVVDGVSVVPVGAILLRQREELTCQARGPILIAPFERSRRDPPQTEEPRVPNAKPTSKYQRNPAWAAKGSHAPSKDAHSPAQLRLFVPQSRLRPPLSAQST